MSKRAIFHRICEYCNAPFDTKSNQAKYCSNGCRVMAYKIRHNIPLPDFQIKKIKERIPTKTELQIAEKTRELNDIRSTMEIFKREEEIYLNKIISPLQQDLDSVINKDAKHFKPPVKNDYYAKPPGAIDSLLIKYYEGIEFYSKEKNYNSYTLLKNTHLKETVDEVFHLARLFVIEGLQKTMKEKVDNFKKIHDSEAKIERANELEKAIEILFGRYNIDKISNQGIITNTKDIRIKEFDVYKLSDGFENVFGEPEKGFISMIHGDGGSGKSSFFVKFASYFSKNIGRVCYNSLEEGASKTFQNKLDKYAIYGEFDVIDIHNPNEICKLFMDYELFIIDSITDVYSDADLTMIAESSKKAKTALLLVLHNNRDGKYKGSSFIQHKVDAHLEAVQGVIYPIKNRFLERLDKTYQIFEL